MYGDEPYSGTSMWCGTNDGGIKRGDRADTGDLEAKVPKDRHRDIAADGALEELQIRDAHDPSLGLTNIDDVPPEDWAADTGPTQTGESAEDDWIEVTPDEPRKPPKSVAKAAENRRKSGPRK
jgi:hypothetical protein